MKRTGRRRALALAGWAAAAAACASLPAEGAFARAPSAGEVRAALGAEPIEREVAAFYRARGHRLLWTRNGELAPEADQVVRIVQAADLDGLDPARYRPAQLAAAVDAARSGDPRAIARADVLLSQAFAAYVRDLRTPRGVGKIYVDKELAPPAPSPRALLDGAARAASLDIYVASAVRMNPLYVRLRDGYAGWRARGARDAARERLIHANLERARALPPDPGRRFVLVDAASARLWLYEDGEPVHEMRVVVGKNSDQTPMMAGLIRYVTFNPYWHLPPDLVQTRIAPNVVRQGVSWLRSARYEVVSDWSERPRSVDPAGVDWAAVAAGRKELPVRQLPGAGNAMGAMKFMFPNTEGIYLHDTPERKLFAQADRRQSAGCVRVEDAPRLARWLFGRTVRPPSADPELNVNLPEPVPVYITYLTVSPARNGTLAFNGDPYDRDRALVAQLSGSAPRAAP